MTEYSSMSFSFMHFKDVFGIVVFLVSEHGQKNYPWRIMPWETVREVPGKKTEGLLPQVHLVFRFVLGPDLCLLC